MSKSFGSYVNNFRQNKQREAAENNRQCTFTGQEIKFMHWMSKIEHQIVRTLGVTLLDLPDEAYMMMFEDGYTVDDVVEVIITDFNGFMNNF